MDRTRIEVYIYYALCELCMCILFCTISRVCVKKILLKNIKKTACANILLIFCFETTKHNVDLNGPWMMHNNYVIENGHCSNICKTVKLLLNQSHGHIDIPIHLLQISSIGNIPFKD